MKLQLRQYFFLVSVLLGITSALDSTTSPLDDTTVKACITDVTKSSDQTLEYELGTPDKTTNQYSFSTVPHECDQSETTIFSVSPRQESWLFHNPEDKNFRISEFTDRTNLADRYIITVKHSVQDILDPAAPPIVKEVQYTINIIMPCQATDLEVKTAITSTVEYTLGTQPSTSMLPFLFELKVTDPVRCNGFTVTYDLTGVPSIMTLDEANNQVLVAKSIDQNLIDTYQKAKVTARVADDGTGKPLEKSIEFVVIIHACSSINKFEFVPTDLVTEEYTIGQNNRAFGYSLVLENECGYPAEEKIVHTSAQTPDASFFTFDQTRSPDEQFTITKTENLNFVGTYKMKVVASLKVHPSLAVKPQPIELIVTLVVKDPCFDTEFDELNIEDMTTSVLGAITEQDLSLSEKKPKDSVSKALGAKNGLTFCGPRLFRIMTTGHSQYLSNLDHGNQVLSLLSTQDSEIGGPHEITMEAFLVNYPVVKKEVKFTITITQCIVTSLDAKKTSSRKYDVSKPADIDNFTIVAFTQTPACSSEISYDIKLVDADSGAKKPLPEFIKTSADFRDLAISTEGIPEFESYRLSITGTAQPTGLSAMTEFDLQFVDTSSITTHMDEMVLPTWLIIGGVVLVIILSCYCCCKSIKTDEKKTSQRQPLMSSESSDNAYHHV